MAKNNYGRVRREALEFQNEMMRQQNAYRDYNYVYVNSQGQPVYRTVHNKYDPWYIRKYNSYELEPMPLSQRDKYGYVMKYGPKLIKYGYEKEKGRMGYAYDLGRRMVYDYPILGKMNKRRYNTYSRLASRIPFYRGRFFKAFVPSPYDPEYISPAGRRMRGEYQRYKSYRPKKGLFDIFR